MDTTVLYSDIDKIHKTFKHTYQLIIDYLSPLYDKLVDTTKIVWLDDKAGKQRTVEYKVTSGL